MRKIQELPKSSSRLLSSAQIISSVYCVVKELIENALDSASKNVEVKLDDYGLERIEVKDNGCGIDKNDMQFVAKSHFTSKITTYSDLDKVESYGFRGEALGAVCNVADLVITTKSSEESIGMTANFGRDGQIISTKPCPCAQGTTVSVLNLFKNIPVRRQYYRSDKNKKEDLKKIEDLLISFGYIQYDVRFALYHNKNLIWQKPALSSTKDALIHTLGNSVVDYMKYVEYIDEQTQRKIEAFLPKLDAPLTCGLSTASRSIIAINMRPVRIKALEKLLKDYYNKAIQNCGKARYPICYISFTLGLTEVDVNVEPNKTTVFLRHSEEVLAQLSEMLKNFYSTDIVNLDENNLTLDNAVSVQEQKSNATDFLNSLKVTCDAKLQQSKIPFINGSACTVVNSPANKNIVHKNNSLTVTSNASTQEGKVHSTQEPCKKKLKTTSHLKKMDIDNHINTIKDFFSSEELNEVDKFAKIPSNCTDNVPSVTVQRTCVNSNEDSSSNNSIPSGKTPFLVSSNNNLCVNGEYVNDQKQHLRDLPVPVIEQQNNSPKKSVINVAEQNKDAWSRGMLPSGELMQPVAVLQPKPLTKLNPTVKDSGMHNSNIKQLPESTSENNFKRLGDCNHSKKSAVKESSIMEVNVFPQRKMTAFDIFCRSNRLEVASENPQFNSPEIAKILSEKWNRLSGEEKAVYKNKLTKEYKQDIRKKERLGKAISHNLSENKKEMSNSKPVKAKLKLKIKEKKLLCNVEHIKRICLNKNSIKPSCENIKIINNLAPGIWVCEEKRKLYLLNTFRLQEAVIYHRLLETFQFDTELLETPQPIVTNNLGNDAMTVLIQLSNSCNNISGKICDDRLTANGFDIKVSRGDNNEVSAELTGLVKSIAFYGFPDLKELLLLIKEKGLSSKLSECRPSKIVLYLQSEANRMSRQSPACQRMQDVEDLLKQKNSLLANCNTCIHHKTFFNEIWKLNSNVQGRVNN